MTIDQLLTMSWVFREKMKALLASKKCSFKEFELESLTLQEKEELLSSFYQYFNKEQKVNKISEKVRLEDFILLFFKDPQAAINSLKEFINVCKDKALIQKTQLLLKELDEKSKKVEKKNPYIPMSIGLQYELPVGFEISKSILILDDKSKDYFNSAVVTSLYNPTKPKAIGDFKDKPLSELKQYFLADKFYKLKPEQIKELVQAVNIEYCKNKGVPPCAVDFENFPASHNNVTFGMFRSKERRIGININHLNLLSHYKAENNQYMPLHLLQTVIHESQHHVQRANMSKEDVDGTDKLVQQQLLGGKIDQKKLDFVDYLLLAEEQDSRNAALVEMRVFAEQSNDSRVRGFYNVEKRIEKRNLSKTNAVSEFVDKFGELHSSFRFDERNSEGVNTDRNNFIQTMAGSENDGNGRTLLKY